MMLPVRVWVSKRFASEPSAGRSCSDERSHGVPFVVGVGLRDLCGKVSKGCPEPGSPEINLIWKERGRGWWGSRTITDFGPQTS